MTPPTEITLLSPDELLPTELTEPERERRVRHTLLWEGIWRVPVWVERSSLAIMDGHHRHAASIALGLERLPVVLLDYDQVEVSSRRPDVTLTPDTIIARATADLPYPAKTTRHSLKPGVSLPPCRIALGNLRPFGFTEHLTPVWATTDGPPHGGITRASGPKPANDRTPV